MELNLNTFNHLGEETISLVESCSEKKESGSFMKELSHRPVMLKEVLSMLNLKDGMVVVDCTLGLGGHASSIVERIVPHGWLIGIDKDEESLSVAKENLKKFSKNCLLIHDDFRNLDKTLERHGIDGIDAVFLDLGVSSYQLGSAARGFSFQAEGPLDMRMDRKGFISAYDLLNNLTEDEISSILRKFGQERFAHRIAHSLVKARQRGLISSTKELAELVLKVLPYKARFQRIHPATRTFQALRIAVNRELDALDEALKKAALFLNKGGRICVVSYHSLEDKIVKENFREFVKTERFQCVFKKILRPSREEIQENPRSRSAKMRVIERIR